MIDRLVDEIIERYDALSEQLAEPGIFAEGGRFAEVSKAHADLQSAYDLAREYAEARTSLRDVEVMLAERGLDAEMKEFLDEERAQSQETMERLEDAIRLATLEKDPRDEKDIIVEIRAGAGGDEAALFAAELYRMLTRYAEHFRYKHQVLSTSESPLGGVKEIVFEVKGRGAFGVFKYESGVHRVQRVPVTESTGRIHTSTATVAVLPEAEEVDVIIDPNDVRVDVYRSTGPGGQSVNTTDSAVRITHVPTGLVVSCQDEKSQLQNKERAFRILRARLLDIAQAEQEAQLAAERRSQVGTGDRAQKIRTYNFPQARVTDHRVGLTSHRLDAVLMGELEEFTEALVAAERAEKLAQLAGAGV
ncbi:MAG: peptide chain release factor 1 [Actinobacteria bacterium]|nr:peptide chain release factor 1 [Actinomycetota bacterium]